jgi:hypothetical protein
MNHPTKIPGYESMLTLALTIECLDYKVQSELFGHLARLYGERSAEDDRARRPVLAAKGQSVRGVAFALRDGLAGMAGVKPKRRKAA